MPILIIQVIFNPDKSSIQVCLPDKYIFKLVTTYVKPVLQQTFYSQTPAEQNS